MGELLNPLSTIRVNNAEELDNIVPTLSNPIIPFFTGYINNIAGSGSNYAWGFVGRYYGQEGSTQILFSYGGKAFIRLKRNSNSNYEEWRGFQIGG